MMSTPALPPNPSLVAIILIARTRKGVKRVFHYPPNPGKEKVHAKPDYEESSADDSSSSSDEEYSSLEDDHIDDKVNSKATRNGRIDPDDSGSASPEKNGDGETWKAHEDGRRKSFLGLPYGFERLLCPPAAYHKKRFEMSIAGVTFLGWPVFARENGEWRRRRKSKGNREIIRKMSTISEQDQAKIGRRGSVQIDEMLGESAGMESTTEDEHDVPIDDDVSKYPGGLIPMQEDDENDDATDKSRQDLSMFHMVFVMKPPALEYQVRVDEMYKHVVKKFSRALKWEQARSSYVQKECDKLKSLKAKHESSSENAIRNSTLARAIAGVYSSIATSRIAHVELTTHLSFSLQIPIPSSISHLPDLISPQLPGLWLTTSTKIASNEDLTMNRSKFASHFALLLLSDLPTLLADISATSSPLSAPLANYLRHTTPRKSFSQISQSSGIPLSDIHFLASHLIYWRRARAVPPLHQRHTYIVSPNADMRKLRSATQQYAKVFPPQLPTLPKMLSLLSAGPRPFNTLIPSKDHKAVYFDVLAWMLRGGWVTQLRTYAWVRVPAEIQAAVAREEAEAAAERSSTAPGTDGPDRSGGEASGASRSPSARSSSSDLAQRGSHDDDAGPPDLAPGTLEPPALAPSQRSRASSASSARTAIPARDADDRGEAPLQASLTSTGPGAPVEAFVPRLLLAPTKASGLESRYLAHIARAMEVAEDREARDAWERCLKYFNGEHALEKIAMREGWKRKRVDALRATWGRLGVLLEARHW